MLDSSGNLYFSDANNHRIRRVTADGTITTIAGNGTSGYSGDSGLAVDAKINYPTSLTFDSAGSLYIADTNNHRIRKVDTNGVITTVAGNGTAGYSGDSAAATSAMLRNPRGVALDASGNLYVGDNGNYRVRKVGTNGVISTIAGTGTCCYSGENVAATSASISPNYLALDGSGNIFISNSGGVRRISNAGIIATVAGSGSNGFGGDGGAATSAGLNAPAGLFVDVSGDLYIADGNNQRVRKVSGGIISTIAGGRAGDGEPAPFASLTNAGAIIRDGNGNVFVADTNSHRVRKITPDGSISTIAGTGIAGNSGDGAAAINAQLRFPGGVALDANGNLYISDSGNHRIRKVDANGVITAFAGTGTAGFSGDQGAATAAKLNNPRHIAFDGSGNLLIADTTNHRIRKVKTDGNIFTVAGNGTAGFGGDNAAATSAMINTPYSVTVDSTGDLYIVDRNNYRLRKVDTNGIITTVTGTGTSGCTGDAGLATSASLSLPHSVAIGANGVIVIGDQNCNVRQVGSTGYISTVASSTTGSASMAADSAGNIYVTAMNSYLRRLTPGGIAPVLTIAATHTGNFAPGTAGQFTLTVSNASGSAATTGTVTVKSYIPLSGASMVGSGWNCGNRYVYQIGRPCRRRFLSGDHRQRQPATSLAASGHHSSHCSGHWSTYDRRGRHGSDHRARTHSPENAHG